MLAPHGSPDRRALARAVCRTRALFDAGRPLCDAVRGRLRYELRATWLGGMRILDRVERRPLRRRRPPPGARRCAMRPWLARAAADLVTADHRRPGHEPRHQLLLLVPRAAAAEAHAPSSRCGTSAAPWTMRWTRADVPEQRCASRWRSWRAELDAAFGGGAAAHLAGTGAAAVPPRVQPAARTVRGADRRRRDGSRALRAMPTFDALAEYCRRVASTVGPDLRRDLRLRGSAHAVVRRESRHGAAVDEHHPRRRRRPAARAHLPARRGPRAIRRHRGRSARRHGDAGRAGAAAGSSATGRASTTSARPPTCRRPTRTA